MFRKCPKVEMGRYVDTRLYSVMVNIHRDNDAESAILAKPLIFLPLRCEIDTGKFTNDTQLTNFRGDVSFECNHTGYGSECSRGIASHRRICNEHELVADDHDLSWCRHCQCRYPKTPPCYETWNILPPLFPVSIQSQRAHVLGFSKQSQTDNGGSQCMN